MKVRMNQLITLLIESNDVLTVSQISGKLGVSKKTIRNDLQEAQKHFEAMEIELIKKSGVGIYVKCSQEKKLEALNILKRNALNKTSHGGVERQIIIIKKILFSRQKITIAWLENYLYVSKTSIYKDLEYVTTWFSERDIELTKDKYGRFILIAGEKRMRKAIFDWRSLCNKALSRSAAEAMTKDTIIGMTFARERSRRIVKKIEAIFQVVFAAEDFNGLIYKLSISLHRMQEGAYVTLKPETLTRLSQMPMYKEIDAVCSYIERDYCLHLPASEKGYLMGLLASLKIHRGDKNWNVDASFTAMNHKISKAVFELISQHLTLKSPEGVYDKIFNHVQTLSNQINFSMFSFHPMAEQIYQTYDVLKDIVDALEPIYKALLDYDLLVSDKSEWLILLASIVEQQKSPLRCLYVYSHKLRDAGLSIQTLCNNYKQIEIIKAIPVDAFDERKAKDVDLVFLDDPTRIETHYRYMVVPPLLNFKDKTTLFFNIARLYEEVNYDFINRGRKAF